METGTPRHERLAARWSEIHLEASPPSNSDHVRSAAAAHAADVSRRGSLFLRERAVHAFGVAVPSAGVRVQRLLRQFAGIAELHRRRRNSDGADDRLLVPLSAPRPSFRGGSGVGVRWRIPLRCAVGVEWLDADDFGGEHADAAKFPFQFSGRATGPMSVAADRTGEEPT